ncbi:Scr1 family TA system antitoxin-like transcriptional regulator [Streptomyces griseoloalbus]|uniref:Scr1 family TA system antitoxin-like transcriptional regulator n=1 Tax=Streptomyces griseoloalbus TaxID=67303 RepID=A0ABV3EFA7_9ACTN
MNPELPDKEVDRWVEHRMRRRVIIGRPEPIPYETVVHEAALRIRVGDRAQVGVQLRRVLELSEADHVTVRVIPFDVDGFGGAGSAVVYAGTAAPAPWPP